MYFTELKNFMDRLTSWIIPGNSISVYHKNEEIYTYSSGYSDIEEKTPMNADMYLNIYSCSKVATVVAGLQLLEKGYLLLTDPLYDYIPAYREMYVEKNGNIERAKNTITIRDLFCMTAGFTYNLQTAGIEKARKLTNGQMDTVTVAECLAEDPLAFEPGTNWNYSVCHDVLGAVIEIVSGKRFADYMKENVFAPCGITKVEYHHTDETIKNIASQYRYSTEGAFDPVAAQRGENSGMKGTLLKVGHERTLDLGPMHDSGGGGVIKTVREYAKFANALANYGKSKLGEQILSKGSVELLRTNQLNDTMLKSLNWSQLQGYGYGLGVRTLIDKAKAGSVGPLGEFGWGGAAGATVLIDPDNEFSFVYAHHMLNPQEDYYQPRLRNVAYKCFNK